MVRFGVSDNSVFATANRKSSKQKYEESVDWAHAKRCGAAKAPHPIGIYGVKEMPWTRLLPAALLDILGTYCI